MLQPLFQNLLFMYASPSEKKTQMSPTFYVVLKQMQLTTKIKNDVDMFVIHRITRKIQKVEVVSNCCIQKKVDVVNFFCIVLCTKNSQMFLFQQSFADDAAESGAVFFDLN